MNDKERADWLARALDDLLNGDRSRPKEPPPPDLDREELTALLRIARARADAADSLMHSGLKYEAEVWQRVLQRLDRRRSSRKVRPFDASGTAAAANLERDMHAARELDEMDIDELRDIARMRRALAEHAAALAEEHREDVWQRVQSRLQGTSTQPWPLCLFRRKGAEDRQAKSIGNEAGDPGLAGLVSAGQYWSQMARRAAEERESRAAAARRSHTRSGFWPRLAATGAVAAVIAAALGPLPATGFADHPVTRLVRSIGDYVGVRETREAPPMAPVTGSAEGTEVSAAEASLRLGAPVTLPAQPPAGFELTSSRFFETALTADSGGVFVLTYAGPGHSSLAVYQERASGGYLAVDDAAATAVTLPDGTPATYVEGMWQQTAGGLTWSEGGAQSLVFERAGVRTTVQYTGPESDSPSLFALANGLAATP